MTAPYASASRAARAYSDVSFTSDVESAEPHRLILMLFDGAIRAVRDARIHQAAGRIGARGESVGMAIQIIGGGLKASLDPTAGGALAAQLAELYDYLSRRLLLASAHADESGFAECERLLQDLRDAWARIPREKA